MAEARFTGQTYGQAAQQQASQRVVPTGPPPTEGGMPPMLPFDRPTEFPNEPVTAGAQGGPGSNIMPMVGVAPGSKEDLVFKMRAMVSKYPNSALITLLEHLESM